MVGIAACALSLASHEEPLAMRRGHRDYVQGRCKQRSRGKRMDSLNGAPQDGCDYIHSVVQRFRVSLRWWSWSLPGRTPARYGRP
jgi:hypothetical protein